jgi:integrase
MSLTKQSKVLTKDQISTMATFLINKRNGLRNQTIFYLSVLSGLRSKEISHLSFKHILTPTNEVSDHINLTNDSSKGKNGGRIIPIHPQLKKNLIQIHNIVKTKRHYNPKTSFVLQSERQPFFTTQSITNIFQSFYKRLGYNGCSSHSGRRTFITNTAKRIHLVGGTLKDIQYLSGHSSITTTQRYIEGDTNSQNKVVRLLDYK